MSSSVQLTPFSLKLSLVLVVSVVVFTNFEICRALEDDSNDLVLTAKEKEALDKLKENVLNILPEEFMKTDFYLVRWIRVANLDVGKAQSLLQKNVEWRQRENISQIINEDFSDVADDFHMTFGEGVDNIGRPLGTIDIGDWDLRGAIINGRQNRLSRYLRASLESGMLSLLESQKKAIEKNVVITKSMTLIDAERGNARQHLCPRCLAILIQWLQEGETYYPRFSKEIILINAPPVAAVGMEAMKPFMSADTRRILKIFDGRRDIWMKYLDERIPRSERTHRYGGTKP